MSEISELEARLGAALHRIAEAVRRPAVPSDAVAMLSAEVERLGAQVATLRAENDAASAEIARLGQALEDEELVTAQQKARNEALHAQLDAALEASAEVSRLKADLAARDALATQFRRVNAQLRQNNLALREANAKGLPDAHLINKAMLTELEAIRASREAERAEIDAVLAELQPLVGEGADA
jgi:chromosome segregation ATPase